MPCKERLETPRCKLWLYRPCTASFSVGSVKRLGDLAILKTKRKDDLAPYWQDEKDWLCIVELLPTDDPEARLFAAEITWSATQISRTHARWRSSEILTPVLTSFYFPFRLRGKALDKLNYSLVDLLGSLLLGPMTAAWKQQFSPELRYKHRQIGDDLVHPTKGQNEIAVPSDVQRRDCHLHSRHRR